jgi:hypothetical protein
MASGASPALAASDSLSSAAGTPTSHGQGTSIHRSPAPLPGAGLEHPAKLLDRDHVDVALGHDGRSEGAHRVPADVALGREPCEELLESR